MVNYTNISGKKTGCGIPSFYPSKRKTGYGCWNTT